MVSQVVWAFKMIGARKAHVISGGEQAGKQICLRGGFPDQF